MKYKIHVRILKYSIKDVVIIPKKLRLRVEDLDADEATDLFHTGRMVARKLEKHYDATSLNFGIQDGNFFNYVLMRFDALT